MQIYSQILKNFVKKNNFNFIDTTNELLKQSEVLYKKSGLILWWYDDTHLNDAGFQILADFLYKKINN